MISSEELGSRVAVLRKRRGKTQAELATALGVSRTTLVAIEKGQRRTSHEELVRFAKELETTVHDLLNEHAVRGAVAQRFRIETRYGLDKAVLAGAVEQLRDLSAKYVELERLHGIDRMPAPLAALDTYRSPGPGRRRDPDWAGQHAARTVRNALDLGDAPATGLGGLLELQAGLRIFRLDLHSRIAAIFIWGEELGGCVALNRQHPPERQRWSLAHEMGHFLRDRESGEILPTAGTARRDASEVFADAFATEFLMPASGVKRRFRDHVDAEGSRFTVADALRMANLFEVSFGAMMRRLEELELLPRGTCRDVSESRLRVRETAEELGLRGSSTALGRFPRRYILLAVASAHEGLMSESELVEYLQCDRLEARRIYSDELRALADDGGEDLFRDLLKTSGR